jgi:hypothetical protein
MRFSDMGERWTVDLSEVLADTEVQHQGLQGRSLMPCIANPDYHSRSCTYRVDKPGQRSERPSYKDDATHPEPPR